MKIQRQIYNWNNDWGLYTLVRDSCGNLIWHYESNTCNQPLSGYPILHLYRAWSIWYPFCEDHLNGDS